MRRAAAILLAALALGHTPFALACVQQPLDSMPCCPGQQSPDGQGHCTGTALCLADGAASVHCACDQPSQTARVSGREIRSSGQAVYFVAPVWPASPVAAHHKPPPQAPPLTWLTAPTGQHIYLATLRLRI
jgi:hypothetical protein